MWSRHRSDCHSHRWRLQRVDSVREQVSMLDRHLWRRECVLRDRQPSGLVCRRYARLHDPEQRVLDLMYSSLTACAIQEAASTIDAPKQLRTIDSRAIRAKTTPNVSKKESSAVLSTRPVGESKLSASATTNLLLTLARVTTVHLVSAI
jgi:hypothetical protein